MTQVNLLPREIRQRQTTRRQTGVVVALGVVAVGALLVMWFLQGIRLSNFNDKIAAQNATNQGLETQVAALQHFAQEQAALEARKALLQSALANTVRWSGVLNKVAQVEPNTMWLDTLTGTATAPAAAVPGTVPGGTTSLVGTISFSGSSLDTATIALWLTNLQTVPGWVNPWFSSAAKADVNGTTVWSFSSTVDLDTRAAHQGGLP
ncbi:MAG: PilN domain-containing protein [Actinomycetota bacterium]